jgi:DNA polymerase elongation subunit (family B)
MSYDKLLYGKNETQFVTSLEVTNGSCEVFQEIDGKVVSSFIPNKYWILSNRSLGKRSNKLKGNLYFQYGTQTTEQDEFFKLGNIYKDKGSFLIYDSKEQLLIKDGLTYFKGLKPKDVSILSFDIETLGLNHTESNKLLLISNTYRVKEKIIRKLFAYDDYASESDMIDDWCKWVREVNPSIVIGHNIYSFDFPFLEYIAKRSGTELSLGRNGSPMRFNKKPSQFRIDGSREQSYTRAYIYGREIVDTMFLAIRYDIGKKYESYGLKPIVKQEKLEVKDRQFYDASTIRFNYQDKDEWQKIKQYCIHDSDDALAIYDLMIPSQFYWCQMVPKSFQGLMISATGSQINGIMIRSYLQEGHSIPKADDVYKYEGAISYGAPGLYDNCLKWDVASLYPSIMIEFEVHDEDKDPNKNFLYLIKKLTEQRLNHKRLAKETGLQYYKDLEQAEKIGANSCYGFLGAAGLNFNSPQAAEYITQMGRTILKTAIKWSTGKDYENT